MKKQLLLLFIICFNAFALHAQFAQQWIQTYDDSLHRDNEPYAITLNNTGCIIVTGTTFDTTLNRRSINTLKYDASGNILWQVNYAPPFTCRPTAITTDANGNIFISADVFDNTSNRTHVLKYNCSGSLVWDALSPIIRFFINLSSHIELDDNGNVFVGTTSDCWLCYPMADSNDGEADIIKFDSNGNFITEMRTGNIVTVQQLGGWLNTLNDMEIVANHIYSITNLMQDSLGNTFNLDIQDFGVAKHDTSGTRSFLKRIRRPSKQDFPVDLFVGNNEDIFITGWTKDTVANAKKSYLTAKLDSSGNILYVQERGDTAWNSEGAGIVADGLGYAYVAGRTLQNGATADIEIIKYTPNGNQVWVQTYNSTFNSWDYPVTNSIHIDAQANIYINAYSKNATNFDFLVLKYDSTGSLIGEYRTNGASNQNDYPGTMAVNNAGEIYSTGSSQSANGYDYLTVKDGFPTTSTGDSLCPTVGINETNTGDELSFSVYPNPVNSELTVQCSENIKEIKIIDVLGNEIYQTNILNPNNKFIIPTFAFLNGLYFIQLKTGNRSVIQKFIKLY